MGCQVTAVKYEHQVIDGKRTLVEIPTFWSFEISLGSTSTTHFRYDPIDGEELSEETVNRLIWEHLDTVGPLVCRL